MRKTISTDDLAKKLESENKPLLVDVLSEKSFGAWHIPGAKNLPYSPEFTAQFKSAFPEPIDAEIIVYCASSGCQMSSLAADALTQAGYTNVIHYEDGLAGWKNSGRELETVK